MRINELIRYYEAVKSAYEPMPKSVSDKLSHVARVFGDMPASSTGIEIAAAAKAAWPTASPGTMRRYLVQLRAVMHRAERDGIIQKSPLIDVPYVHDTVYVDVNADEVKMLLDFLQWTEPRWYPLVLLLCHTGARLGEALAMSESNFTRLGVKVSKVVGRRTKTIDRIIPYTNRLQRAVASGVYKRHRIAPDGVGDASVASCLGRVLDDATKSLGLPKLRVHDLRHAFAAMLAEGGADLADLATALGHSSTAMSMRYRGLVRGKLTGLMASI